MASNIGIIPGDLLIPGATNWPGLTLRQAIERGIGHRFDPNIDNATGYHGMHPSPDNSKVLLWWTGAATTMRVQPIDASSPVVNTATTMPGTKFSAAWRPDGTEIACSSSASPFVRRWLASDMSQIADFSTGDLPPIATSELRYSPNSRYLAVGYDASTFNTPGLRCYDLTTNLPVTITGALPASNVLGLDFSPDNAKLFAIPRTSGHTAALIDTTTWVSEGVTGITSLGTQDKCVRFSPDGTKVAVVRGGTTAGTTISVYGTAGAASTWASQAITMPAGLPAAVARWVEWIDNSLLVVGYASQVMFHVIDVSTNPATLVGKVFDFGAIRFGLVSGGAKRFFGGTVKDGGGNPLQREVRVVHRSSGRLLATTVSSAVDGKFAVMVTCPQPCIVYAVGSGGEIVELFDSVTPVSALP